VAGHVSVSLRGWEGHRLGVLRRIVGVGGWVGRMLGWRVVLMLGGGGEGALLVGVVVGVCGGVHGDEGGGWRILQGRSACLLALDL
jgi:hypothetical protein